MYFVYILANRYNNVLYIGVTNNLKRRTIEHKTHLNRGFTWKYNVEKLVYYQSFVKIKEAIKREKNLKRWKRAWKEELISSFNPEWRDLADDILEEEKDFG